MNDTIAESTPIPHVGVLRSIANSIEPAFPDAADTLRGIARDLAPAPVPDDAGGKG